MRGTDIKRRHQLIRPVAFGGCLVNSRVIGLDALGAHSVIGHRRLRVYIIDARDGINEVVVSSKRVPDQSLREDAGVTSYRSARCKAGLSNKCSAIGPEPPWRNDVTAGVTTFQRTCDDVTDRRNSVSVTCNDVTAKRTDTSSRLEHVSLVVGFGRLDLRSGRSIWVYGGGGLPSRRSALASTRSARATVSMFEVLDRTENLPPGKPTRHYRKTLRRTEVI